MLSFFLTRVGACTWRLLRVPLAGGSREMVSRACGKAEHDVFESRGQCGQTVNLSDCFETE